MTGWSSCWAASRRRASVSRSGSTAWSWRSRRQAWLPAQPEHPTVVVCGADPADTATRLRIATDLRAAGLAARADLNVRKLGRQLESAARDGAHFAVIVGDELANGQVQLRDLPAATQKAVHLDDLARELTRAEGSHRHGTPSSPEPA